MWWSKKLTPVPLSDEELFTWALKDGGWGLGSLHNDHCVTVRKHGQLFYYTCTTKVIDVTGRITLEKDYRKWSAKRRWMR